MIFEQIQKYLRLLDVNADVQQTQLAPLEQHLADIRNTEKNQCSHSQASSLLVNLGFEGEQDIAYVFGYSYRYRSFEHVAVRINGIYYDPVYPDESVVERRFIKVWELNVDELLEFLERADRPPTIYDWLEIKRSALASDN